MAKLNELPEFKALQTVLRALKPLTPEGRRKVIEATHALITISAGTNSTHQDCPSGKSQSHAPRKKAHR